VRLRQVLQNRFVRIPGRDSDMHAALREQLGATRTDTGATPNDEGNILYGCVSVGLGHVLCFRRWFGGKSAAKKYTVASVNASGN
jgi:hypothetical protein